MAKSNLIDGLFSTRGRSPRSEWWLVGVGLSVLGGLLSTLAIIVLFGGEAMSAQPAPADVGLVRLIASLLIAWPIIAVSVRRAHDRGNSGWLAFVYYGLNLGLGAVSALAPEVFAEEALMAGSPLGWTVVCLSFIQIGVMLWLIVTLGFLPGKREANRYGPPLGGGGSNYRAPSVE